MDPLGNGDADEAGPDERVRPGPAPLAWIEKTGVDVSALAIIVLGVIITVSVLGRTFFGKMIPDDIVISGELMVTLVALPWAYVTADRGHVAVEVFTDWMSRGAQVWLELLAVIVGLVMVAPLTWATGVALWQAWDFGSYFDGVLYLPEWPGRLTFFIGFALMLVRLLFILVGDVGRLRRGPDGHDEVYF
ncbi:TRAP transporter small permease [Oceanibacterium hippocampi]|uniref:TRAP transporter small permease protein n=1 Tax=Oceanibacterium hippocampi TaxID=745714 RepID=A0A1Y5TXB0_9PROT|nr:TRAP transporter small permease [Oceanibacterium hippocampi]SLN75746.1 Tripartite ATP-independent periplasmic transporters, DctQ component [Oceanibacterium hippocampi]